MLYIAISSFHLIFTFSMLTPFPGARLVAAAPAPAISDLVGGWSAGVRATIPRILLREGQNSRSRQNSKNDKIVKITKTPPPPPPVWAQGRAGDQKGVRGGIFGISEFRDFGVRGEGPACLPTPPGNAMTTPLVRDIKEQNLLLLRMTSACAFIRCPSHLFSSDW